jgi:hypothetical protein
MGHQFGRQVRQFRRHLPKMSHAGGADDETCPQGLHVIQPYREAIAQSVERNNLTFVQIGDEAPLEVQCIGAENVQTYRDAGVVVRDAPIRTVGGQGPLAARVTQA